MTFDSDKYTHDADRAAMKALRAIPGFSTLLKAFMNVWNERQQKILNMSTRIKIGENQMKKYYDMLPPVCAKLGIPVPDLYLEMNVVPNAYTSGDTEPFIVLTSGLLKTLPEELIPTILAHECGHIACHHVLYLTMGRIVLQGAGSVLGSVMKLGALLTVPLQMAFFYWMRCSEFSADRVAVLCDGTDSKMEEVCLRLAGWDKEIDAEVSLEAFMDQAADYRELIQESKWNKTLEFLIQSQATHPLMALRATECRNWFRSEKYREAAGFLTAADARLEAPPLRLAEPAFFIPRDYKPLSPKEGDPAGSKVYGRVTTQCNSFIQVYPIPAEESLCNETTETLIAGLHAGLPEDEGLIRAECGVTAKGRKYACSIVKTMPKPRCTEYRVTLHISLQDSVTAVRAYFMETGAPGYREALVKSRLQREQPGSDPGTGWSQDPYDPQFTRGLLMNESEKEKYDTRFPLHPLTEARGFAAALIAGN